MNTNNYFTKAAMLVILLGLITVVQSCTKTNQLSDASADPNLVGAWKRVIPRTPLGDSVQTIAFYDGAQFATLQTDVYATKVATSATSTLYKGTYNTNGTVVYLNLNQKLNSTDPNSSGSPISQLIFDKAPYKISGSLDTLTVTSGGTLKYIKVNQ